MNKGEREEQRDAEITLWLLETVGKNSELSQRHLASHLGVALGLANSYLKRCVRKGLVKMSEAPPNRYLYYLTPKGFAEKSRLTGKYLSSSFSFYRKASESCRVVFQSCADSGWRQVVLCGVSDLAEIASLRAMERGIAVSGVYDPESDDKDFLNLPVWNQFEHVPPADGFVLTDLKSPYALYEKLKRAAGPDQILVPDILRVE